MLKIHRILIGILAISFSLIPPPLAASRPETVRVAISRGLDEIKIDGDGLLVADENGAPLSLSFPATLRRGSEGRVVAAGRTVARLTIASPEILTINGKGYKGRFDIYPAERGLLVVDEIPIEDYLVGLINCEISSLWPVEAVKAQAVIARSYALYQKDSRRTALYHLESSVMDQVYEGVDIEDNRAARAVSETAGEVLTFDGSIIQAFYHSNCGGHTEAAVNVWGGDVSYLRGVDCKYCVNSPSTRWEAVLSIKKVETLLKNAGYHFTSISNVKTGKTNRSGRLQEVNIISSAKAATSMSAVSFRKSIGYSLIKSTNFSVRQRGEELVFSGIGNGHGVGLCQWGSKQRANDRFDYREILSYYYPGTRLEKLKN
jgi:stage II sporulation protein D